MYRLKLGTIASELHCIEERMLANGPRNEATWNAIPVEPPPVPEHYLGVWERTLFLSPEHHDTCSIVFWLQTHLWHADLRIPKERPGFRGITQLSECSEEQLTWLARQQGFAGITQVQGDQCTWHRQVDYQPAHGNRDISHMRFHGDVINETGVEADYFEIWERRTNNAAGTTALELMAERGNLPIRRTWLLLAGDYFMLVRDRATALPKGESLSLLMAKTRPKRAELLAWLDFEISIGYCTGITPWRIELSTLPYREGQYVSRQGDIRRHGYHLAIEPHAERRWMILDWGHTSL